MYLLKILTFYKLLNGCYYFQIVIFTSPENFTLAIIFEYKLSSIKFYKDMVIVDIYVFFYFIENVIK